MVRELFQAEPDPWQVDVLEAFPHNQRIALTACKGPGKTCVLAWLAWNFLLTRPHAQVAATSISADNLADGLWKEMANWQHRSPLLTHLFEWQKTRIICKERPQTWFMSARAWPKSGSPSDQANVLAGLHSDYIMFILDESGGIPDAVMVAAEAALSSPIEGHILQAGNPTNLAGPLYRANKSARHLWHVVNITGDPDDPKRSPRVSVEWAREQIAQYGRDNAWVLVNVFGQFPPGSLDTLIGMDEIIQAQRRSYREPDIAKSARVLGVDVARFGDDASVIFPRQGIVAFTPIMHRNVTGYQGAGIIARKWAEWNADAVFIDDTGGYGAAWIEALHQLGRSPVGVPFSGSAHDPRYYNKRTEMYFDLVEWIKRGGQLPPADAQGSAELANALTQTTYSFKGDKMILEPKDMIKARLGGSPDHADALALTFAQPVSPKALFGARGGHRYEYDPFHEARPTSSRFASAVSDSYDPFSGGH